MMLSMLRVRGEYLWHCSEDGFLDTPWNDCYKHSLMVSSHCPHPAGKDCFPDHTPHLLDAGVAHPICFSPIHTTPCHPRVIGAACAPSSLQDPSSCRFPSHHVLPSGFDSCESRWSRCETSCIATSNSSVSSLAPALCCVVFVLCCVVLCPSPGS